MRLLRRLAYLLHRRKREQDLADEIAFHRELAAEEHRAAGLAPAHPAPIGSCRLSPQGTPSGIHSR